jgi:hypothetical protein
MVMGEKRKFYNSEKMIKEYSIQLNEDDTVDYFRFDLTTLTDFLKDGRYAPCYVINYKKSLEQEGKYPMYVEEDIYNFDRMVKKMLL